jgi:hypothetical protein
MRKVYSKRALVTKVFTLGLLALLTVPLLAIPAQAQPPGAEKVGEVELEPIWIYNENGELQKFVIEDEDVRGYKPGGEPVEGEFEIGGKTYKCPDEEGLCICEACVFRVMKLAISQLSPEDIPNQANFKVTWSHPCPGHEKTFRYITGNAADYKKDIPGGTSKKCLTLDNYKYTFTYGEEEFTTRVLDDVFPKKFFDLREEWIEAGKPETGDGDIGDKFVPLWEEVRDKFLTMELDELFEFEKEEESVPWWPIVFALGLTAAIIGTTVYSITRTRR